MTAWGALIGLLLSILFIIKKIPPVYSLILGAIVGGLIGGFSLPQTVVIMLDGVKDITPAILRILGAGVLSGVLVKTGAAASISNTIVQTLNERHAFLALAFATMLLTAIGVFIDVAVITVAPIALGLGQRLSIPKGTLLIAMIGGGKCGNIISPNPNTIVAAGATVASSLFAETIMAAGISGIWGAAMINAGATVLDHLPHGSFYHATGGSVNLSFSERLKLVPYETAIGFILTAGSVVTYLLVR
ncbi:hypothetical protein AGMMS49574_01090 [Bacteroidia bacterium]|nr:hypothetical protein AGMMS49574_01090 [Bacteroidia bacterium]